jgi:very-short-patch-repair endonuclease
MAEHIVGGQKVAEIKSIRARELRQQMTVEEKILWQHLRNHGLSGLHFRRQQVISGFIVDCYCHAAALVIEVDGPIHAINVEYDRERDAILAERGLRVLRFTNQQVQDDLFGVLALIEEACSLNRQICE